MLTLWVTFAPCFAFVFLGAPMIERIREKRALAAALTAITAAVVGVIANVALWFGLRVVFAELKPVAWGPFALELPVPASIDPLAAAITVVSAIALFRFQLGVIKTLALASAIGLVLRAGIGW